MATLNGAHILCYGDPRTVLTQLGFARPLMTTEHYNNFRDIQDWSSRDLSLGLETSRDPFLQVLVSVPVLEPQSLGLGLGLGTLESRSWSWDLGLGLHS